MLRVCILDCCGLGFLGRADVIAVRHLAPAPIAHDPPPLSGDQLRRLKSREVCDDRWFADPVAGQLHQIDAGIPKPALAVSEYQSPHQRDGGQRDNAEISQFVGVA